MTPAGAGGAARSTQLFPGLRGERGRGRRGAKAPGWGAPREAAMSDSQAGRVEIGLEVFNPMDAGFIREPGAVWRRLAVDYPMAFHRDMGMWVVSSHALCRDVLRDARFSPNFRHWEFAPA